MFDDCHRSEGPTAETNRRRLLKKLTATAAAVPFGMQLATASDDSRTDFDTTFDPSDEREVARFVSSTFDWSNEVHDRVATTAEAETTIKRHRDAVRNDLSDKQLTAVQDFLKRLDIILENPNERSILQQNADVSPQSCNNYTDSVKGYIHVPYVGNTLHAFTFEIDIGWCVDNNKVINVVPSNTGNPQKYLLVNWDYRGLADESLTFHPDKYYAISYQKGKYKRCLITSSGLTCVSTDYGWVEAVVYNDRSRRTIDKGASG